jgi:hypothetical protein
MVNYMTRGANRADMMRLRGRVPRVLCRAVACFLKLTNCVLIDVAMNEY